MRPKISSLALVVVALLAGGVTLAVAQGFATLRGVPFSALSYDTTSLLDVPPYTGALSTLNCMLWSATAALSAFVAWILPADRRPMTALAVLAAGLGADDALRLHEGLGPRFGIPEELTMAIYAFTGLWLGWTLLRRGPAAAMWAYIVGAALLASSVATDLVEGPVLLEDGAKLLGTLVWLTVPVVAFGSPPVPAGSQPDEIPTALRRWSHAPADSSRQM